MTGRLSRMEKQERGGRASGWIAVGVVLASLWSCRSGGRDTAVVVEAHDAFETADLILQCARVHTLDADGVDNATAIAIRGSRILAISGRDGILRHRGAQTRLIEFLGAHIYPGLQDAHGHIEGLGDAGLDLKGAASYADLVDRVAAYASTLPAGAWVKGRGWDQNRWPVQEMPDHAELSAVTKSHPVFLTRVDGHAALCNAMALEKAGIRPDTNAPDGGRILRREDGQATGVLVDNAMGLVTRLLAAPDHGELERRLLEAQAKCLEVGLTRVHDAGVSGPARRVMRELEAAGAWKLGVYGMLPAPSGPEGLPKIERDDPRAKLRFRAVKLYADGALGSSLAALLRDYSDEAGNQGQLTTPADVLRTTIGWCREQGYQPCIHAIGDRANRLVLDAYEQLFSPEDRASLRPRIEHAQVVEPTDLQRFAALGVIASMQPTHLTSDMPWAPQRLGPDRIPGSYAFRTLLEDHAHVCFGSDFPVEPEDPVAGVFAAVTTIPPSSPDAQPLRPDQVLTRRQALEGFTTGASYAAFEEEVRGRIQPGYEADLTILDRDLLDDSAPARAILGTRVLATIIGGEVVYQRPGN
ncbi:MAG: amidohydrolase [Planctomycetes bacterium]|nr:amidohydrolase [Planctomycetota bacterium]